MFNLDSFNPRARDGREANIDILQHGIECFNPRARDGREAPYVPYTLLKVVSIHAPVMDANAILYIHD